MPSLAQAILSTKKLRTTDTGPSIVIERVRSGGSTGKRKWIDSLQKSIQDKKLLLCDASALKAEAASPSTTPEPVAVDFDRSPASSSRSSPRCAPISESVVDSGAHPSERETTTRVANPQTDPVEAQAEQAETDAEANTAKTEVLATVSMWRKRYFAMLALSTPTTDASFDGPAPATVAMSTVGVADDSGDRGAHVLDEAAIRRLHTLAELRSQVAEQAVVAQCLQQRAAELEVRQKEMLEESSQAAAPTQPAAADLDICLLQRSLHCYRTLTGITLTEAEPKTGSSDSSDERHRYVCTARNAAQRRKLRFSVTVGPDGDGGTCACSYTPLAMTANLQSLLPAHLQAPYCPTAGQGAGPLPCGDMPQPWVPAKLVGDVIAAVHAGEDEGEDEGDGR